MNQPYFAVLKLRYKLKLKVINFDLDFPYLIPLSPGTTVQVFDVENITGFWGKEEPQSWYATGFKVQPGEPVYACRNGIVVEVAGQNRTGAKAARSSSQEPLPSFSPV